MESQEIVFVFVFVPVFVFVFVKKICGHLVEAAMESKARSKREV